METVPAVEVDEAELERLERLVASLPSDSPLAAALEALALSVRRGGDVVVAAQSEQLTPSQAAAVLRMSRTHLYKVMDAGDLPFFRVGRDRRIAVDDLFLYRARRDQDKRALAERFAHVTAGRERAVAEEVARRRHDARDC